MLALKPLKVLFDRVNLKMVFVDTKDRRPGYMSAFPFHLSRLPLESLPNL